MGDRAVDVERLAGLLDLLLLGHRGDRAHVVQAIGQLDQDDPDVRGHRDHHLAVVLGLRLVARLERQPGELGDAVDQSRHLVAERLAYLLERRRRVLDGVVQQRRAQRLGVEAHPRADLRHADRMDDEVLAGAPALIGMVDAGVHERILDPVPIDHDGRLVSVLLDDREQIRQQPALDSRQLGALDRGLRVRALDPVDRGSQRDQRGAPPAAAAAAGLVLRTRRLGLLRVCQPLCRGLALLRNRRPSSYRCS